jgi:hypothetical protein
VILSNKPGKDLFGKDNDTILLRNGVTGTAAKKTLDNKIIWFYHGKPLNDGYLSLCITVTQEQFTMAYQTDGTAARDFIVHGDTPISRLGKAQIGDVGGIPFYLNIYLRRKRGRAGFINVLDQKGQGYIHGPSEIPCSPIAPLPDYIKLALNGEQTTSLQNLLDFYELGRNFQIQRSIRDTAHQTLVYHRDMSKEQYRDVVHDIYNPLRDKLVEMTITSIVADDKCVAFLTETPRAGRGVEVPRWPRDKIPHITMRLRDHSVQPVYSNELAQRVVEVKENGRELVGACYVQLPQPIKLLCRLVFHYN